jgi:DNA-binding response OmpR family regulator/REP element-mobilizing transposase RayT
MTITRKALIVSSDKAFGRLLSQVIEEFAHYQIEAGQLDNLTFSPARLNAVDLLILDADLLPVNINDTLQKIANSPPGLQTILIPSKRGNALTSIQLSGFEHVLPQPFYLPDFIAALEAIASQWRKTDAVTPNEYVSLEWLQEPALAAQHLAGLALETSSELSLITKGEELWATAGELPQPAVQEIGLSATRFWRNNKASDLARFVHLHSTGEDYLLYIQPLVADYALTVVFNAKLPFSEMREQVGGIAETLRASTQQSVTVAKEDKARVGDPVVVSKEHQKNFTQEYSDLTKASGKIRNLDSQPLDMKINQDEAIQQPSDAYLDAQVGQTGELLYSYALIPRLPNHFLEGDLAYRLSQWLPQLCLAFSARLEHLEIKATALSWTISVVAEQSPIDLVKNLEQELSRRIFESFPELKDENPSGEFWAQGAFVSTEALSSEKMIAGYIAQTRARQGIPGGR